MEILKSFDLEINDELFYLFSDLIYRTSGIKLGIHKKGLLVSRLLKRLTLLGIKDFHCYLKRVKSDNEELVQMLNCISTNTTKFFREKYHFEYLKDRVMPELIQSCRDRTIRIWSAGCSTGEEPYSIAMTVFEALRNMGMDDGTWDIKILATDISTKVLGVAEEGIYELEQLPDTLPGDMITRYFLKGVGKNRGRIKVKDSLKEAIRFRRLNLKDSTYPFKRKFDVIFCRNVMIYFDEDMKQHVLSNFHYYLSSTGYLFLGHSEAMLDREQFTPVYITVYRKR